MQSGRVAISGRLARLLFGPAPIRKLAVIHLAQAMGDGLFAVSLAGSLFFNVSIDAARPNILLYLLVTMAPFAVLAPLVGPLVDRVADGYPRVVGVANVARTLLCLLLALHLRTLLFYPEALGVLVAAKTYSVAKAALVPRMQPQRSQLLASNARLSRLGALGAAVGGGAGAGIILVSRAEIAVILAGAAFCLAAVLAFRLPRLEPDSFSSPAEEFEELHDPDVLAAAASVAVLRAASGFLAFFIAFHLKRTGAPPWLFGVMAGASTFGAVAGTVIGPKLRSRYQERALLRGAMVLPALCCLLGAVRVTSPVLIVSVGALAISSNIGRLAFDSIVQAHAPDVDRGRAFAGFETRFQLAWVAGAVGPVGLRIPGWAGLLATALLMAAGGLAFNVERKAVQRWRKSLVPPADLGRAVLEHARRLQASGQFCHAVLEAALLLDLIDVCEPTGELAAAQLRRQRAIALRGDAGPSEAQQAVQAAAVLYGLRERRPTSPPMLRQMP
jgi:MFS family permease